MKILSIARKTILELLREPLLLWLLLLFPAGMVAFYYFAFGQTESGLSTYLHVMVLNDDEGAKLPGGSHWVAGTDLIDTMRAAEWDGDSVFEVMPVTDRRAAEIALRERKASLLLSIPPDFTQALLAGAAAAGDGLPLGAGDQAPAALTLVGDQGSDSYVFAQSLLNGLVRQFAGQVAGWQEETASITYEFLPGTGTMSDFDWGVAGIIIFGVMFLSITTATVLVREEVTGTLRRLRLTRTRSSDLILGVTLAQMVTALVLVPLTFAVALAFGFRSQGSLLLAMAICLLLCLSAVGLGLAVACFARNDGEAANIAAGVMVPLVFLSGALYPLPALPLFTLGDHVIQLYDLLPAAHASEALRRVLVFAEGPGDIAYELVAMTILSLLTLALGVFLYRRLKLSRA